MREDKSVMPGGDALFGFLNCFKPSGMTSRDVVNVVQRRIRPTKVGHAGTLDPLAEGVLVLGVGPASRLVPYVHQTPKRYRARFRLGQSSETGDLEGELQIHPELAIPRREEIDLAAKRLTGKITQIPPAYSAVWVDGQRAYQRARAGHQVTVPPRQVTIERITVLAYDYPDLMLDIVCGSGTYIRTLGIDLCQQAGSTAVMSHLLRTDVGPFTLSRAITLPRLQNEPLEPLLESPLIGVSHLDRIEISEDQSRQLGFGQCLRDCETPATDESAECAAVLDGGRLRAIVKPKDGRWYPHRVFPAAARED